MFCPRCGKAEQVSDSYCRQCGFFLPNLSTMVKPEAPPVEHLKANTVLSVLTIITCLTLAILLHIFFGFRSNSHPLIYVTQGLLLAMGGWHIQSLIRNLKLRKQWERRKPLNEPTRASFNSTPTAPLLDHATFEDVAPASVTENTTRRIALPSKLKDSDRHN